jgi:VanZ family protein
MVKPEPLLTSVLWAARLALSGATIAWMALIFYLSSLSQAEVSQPLESPVISWLGVLRSYAAHIVLYGVLASLAQASLWAWKPDYRIRWALAAAAFSALYGISDEYHQSLVGRSGSIADVIVNVFGATVAVAGLWLVRPWCRRITKRLNRSLPHDSTG